MTLVHCGARSARGVPNSLWRPRRAWPDNAPTPSAPTKEKVPVTRARPSIPFLLELLSLAVRKEASALYVVPWMPPTMRIDERVVALSAVSFTPEQTAALVRDVLDDDQRVALDHSRQIQFSFVREGVGRFRVHAFRRHGQPAMAIRPFALPVPTLQSLALPLPLHTIALADRGLVLVASRSPSLRGDGVAALIDHRNRHGRGAILLLEDSSRYWHDAELCAVEQGVSSGHAQERALARSQQPGAAPLAIAWGELRDQPSLARAVHAAASALCFVTMQADSVVEALQATAALGDSPGDFSGLTRLAISLEAAVALRRAHAQDGRDIALAEVLLNSPDVAASLTERDFDALAVGMKALRGRGALMLDDHLLQLVANGTMGYEEAARQAMDAGDFARRWALGPQTAVPAWVHPRPPPPSQPVPMAPPARDSDLDPFDEVFGTAVHPPPRGADTTFESVEWPRTGDHARDPLATLERPGVHPAASDRAAAPGLLPQGRGGAADDRVQFRAYAPAAIIPGSSALVDIWACLPAQEADVARLAGRSGEAQLAGLRAGVALARGTLVTVQLRVEGLDVPEPVQYIDWCGEPVNAAFFVDAPFRATAGTHAARARLLVAGMPIGELSFLLRVAPEPDPRLEDTHAARRMLRNAFASYAAEDRAEVLARVQGMRKVAPDLDIFVDTMSLHAGERWRERIEHELGRRERLFLFWSAHASQSPWVDFEWRLALRTRGLDAIDPVPLADPAETPPPPELAELHFGDVYQVQIEAAARQAASAAAANPEAGA